MKRKIFIDVASHFLASLLGVFVFWVVAKECGWTIPAWGWMVIWVLNFKGK